MLFLTAVLLLASEGAQKARGGALLLLYLISMVDSGGRRIAWLESTVLVWWVALDPPHVGING